MAVCARVSFFGGVGRTKACVAFFEDQNVTTPEARKTSCFEISSIFFVLLYFHALHADTP
jgi:hypothetical protein